MSHNCLPAAGFFVTIILIVYLKQRQDALLDYYLTYLSFQHYLYFLLQQSFVTPEPEKNILAEGPT